MLGRDTDRLRVPRAEGDRVAVRVLVVAREQMTTERTRAINALTALVRAVDLGIDARKPLTTRQVRGIAAWRIRGESLAVATARAESVRLSRRILQISDELRENRVVLTALFRQLAPDIPSSVAWVPWLRRCLGGVVPPRQGSFRGGHGVAGGHLSHSSLVRKHHQASP